MPAYAAVVGGRVKPNDTLKPPMLSLTQSPEEMRVWADKFKAFYLASQLDRVSLAEQQAYLFVCLDSHMAARIKDKARANTPIMEDAPGEESCLSLIEKEFEVKYPKFIWRLKFFQYRQSPGQLFSDYAAKLHKIGNEADLGSVRVEELYIYKYIGGTCNDKLREKFLKEQNPTWEDMKTVYRTYKQTHGALKEIRMSGGGSSSSATADSRSRARSKSREGGRRDDRRRDRRNGSRRGRSQERDGCFRCGSEWHKSHACPRQNDTCYYCESRPSR